MLEVAKEALVHLDAPLAHRGSGRSHAPRDYCSPHSSGTDEQMFDEQ
jgi:hypothetical protein